MRIALTKTTPPKYLNYAHWLSRIAPEIQFGPLDEAEDPLTELESCNGLLLPGGADVDPARYGKEDQRNVCAIDEERDALEFVIIEKALQRELPILGICRGLQVMNVALGGTLITDLPTAGFDMHHKVSGQDMEHTVRIEPISQLAQIIGRTDGEVNSAHHQSAEIVAPRLRVTARSPDGVIEGLEWKEPRGKPYLILIQWHPERMLDQQSPFSKNIAEDFIRNLKK